MSDSVNFDDLDEDSFDYESERQIEDAVFYIDDNSIDINARTRNEDYEISEDLMYDDYSSYLEYFDFN